MRMDAHRLRPDLARLAKEINSGLARGLSRTAEFALNTAGATRDFKDHTGQARASLRHGVRNPFNHYVQAGGNAAPWVLFLEAGTRAHDIRPKKFGTVSSSRSTRAHGQMAPLLRFQIAGRWFSKRVVKHPGTHATHFMQKAREAAEAHANGFFEAELNAVIAR